jgi:hypothetical protein
LTKRSNSEASRYPDAALCVLEQPITETASKGSIGSVVVVVGSGSGSGSGTGPVVVGASVLVVVVGSGVSSVD